MNSWHISFPSSVVCVVFARGLYRWCCSVRWASNCSPSENNSSLARKHRYEWMNMSWNWILVSQMRTSSVFVGCCRQWLLLMPLLFSVDVINIDEIRNFARELHNTWKMYGSLLVFISKSWWEVFIIIIIFQSFAAAADQRFNLKLRHNYNSETLENPKINASCF